MVSNDLPDEMVRELIELDRLARLGIPYVPPSEFVAGFVRIQRGFVGWKQDTLASFEGSPCPPFSESNAVIRSLQRAWIKWRWLWCRSRVRSPSRVSP